MIDGWMGDDWFHYGAFRQVNLDYFTGQTAKTGKLAIPLRLFVRPPGSHPLPALVSGH